MTPSDTPIRHLRTQVSGVEIFYREAGDPETGTIVLLPGHPSGAHAYDGLTDSDSLWPMASPLRDSAGLGRFLRPRSLALPSVALALLVVAGAGLAGKVRFGGPRWLPNINFHVPARHHPAATVKPRAPAPLRHAATGNYAVGSIILWAAVAIVVLVLLLFLWRWWASRKSAPAGERQPAVAASQPTQAVMPEPEPEPSPPVLRSGIELALQLLDEQREPADAVVQAWLGLQTTAERAGIVRRPSETPTEFAARILSNTFGDASALRTLLRLYLRTRFGEHPVTAADVSAVRAALQELIRTWPASNSPVGIGSR